MLSLDLTLFQALNAGPETPAMVLWLEGKKIRQINNISVFSFWFYLASWIPINVLCFIKPIEIWEPIEHTKSIKISQLVE